MDAETYYNEGVLKINLRNYSGAIADFTETIKLDPIYHDVFDDKNASERSKMAACYGRGLADFCKVIKPKSIYVRTYFGIGLMLGYKKYYKNAKENFSEAIDIDPTYAEAYYYRGLTKILLGQIDSGFLDLCKAGELKYVAAYDAIKEYCI